MPQWAGSVGITYGISILKNSSSLVDKEKEAYWGGPSFYIGGAEHAVLHLLRTILAQIPLRRRMCSPTGPYKNFFTKV